MSGSVQAQSEVRDPPPLKGRGIRPWLSLSRHWRLGLAAAALLLMAGLPVVWLKGVSTYSAEAVFQVSPNYQRNLTVDKEIELQSNAQYRDFVSHMSRSVTRYDVLATAVGVLLKKGESVCLPAEDERKCVERLQRTIYVLAVGDSYMVRVGLSTAEKGQSDLVINAVMSSFLDTVRKEQIYGADVRSEVLQSQTASLQAEIKRFESRRAELAGLLGLTTFTDSVSNPYDTLLAQARVRLAQASLERSTAQAALEAFNAKRELPGFATRSLLEQRLQDGSLQILRTEVTKRAEELYRTIAGLEPDHPASRPAAQEQTEMAARLRSREKAFEQQALSNASARLGAALLQTQQVERELQQGVTTLEGRASTFAAYFREALQLTNDMRKREQEVSEIRDRLNFMSTERRALGFVRLVTPALPATLPQGPGRLKLLLALLLACCVLTAVVPLAIDLLDPRVMEVGDAEKVMGFAAAAWLVRVQDSASRLLAREQARRFASTLMRNRARGAGAAFAFSSVKAGGGSTTLLTNLARTLQELGCRVLVVDANALANTSPLRSQGLPGLTDYLQGQARLDELVSQRQLGQHMLSVVPLGQSPGRLQRVDRLHAALAQWRSDYELVLVDTGPLMSCVDAEMVIDAVGQVFLVAEAERLTKAELRRASQQLLRLAPSAVGLVVNKVAMEAGGSALMKDMVETITQGRYKQFMSTSMLRLRLDVWRLQWQRFLMRRRSRA